MILYENIAADNFLFHYDEYGKAVSVEPRMFQVTLEKVLAATLSQR